MQLNTNTNPFNSKWIKDIMKNWIDHHINIDGEIINKTSLEK